MLFYNLDKNYVIIIGKFLPTCIFASPMIPSVTKPGLEYVCEKPWGIIKQTRLIFAGKHFCKNKMTKINDNYEILASFKRYKLKQCKSYIICSTLQAFFELERFKWEKNNNNNRTTSRQSTVQSPLVVLCTRQCSLVSSPWANNIKIKVNSDHRSKFSNLSNWKEEAWKISRL